MIQSMSTLENILNIELNIYIHNILYFCWFLPVMLLRINIRAGQYIYYIDIVI